MNRKAKLIVGVLALVLCFSWSFKANANPDQPCQRQHVSAGDLKGWKLGMQAYSFKEFTFYEAVEKNKALGMRYIEAYPGQRLSKEKPDVKTDHNMSSRDKVEMLQKLRQAGVKLLNYGVVSLPNNEAECRKVFDFAREMGIETIVSEPPEDALGLIDRLCEEYEINVAIHNHPKPSRYWNPDTVMRVCDGRSKWIGVCADTGHWCRSGVDPLEAVKKLGRAGRIRSLHFKDLNEFGNRDAHDCVWGTGISQAKAILTELDRQNFKGVFSIEYEHNWLNSVPEIREAVGYFNKVAGELEPTGWRDLLAEGLSNWTYKPGGWVMDEGVLTSKAGGNIWTKARYGDFVLDLEFKVASGSNSGVEITTTSHCDNLI